MYQLYTYINLLYMTGGYLLCNKLILTVHIFKMDIIKFHENVTMVRNFNYIFYIGIIKILYQILFYFIILFKEVFNYGKRKIY